MKEMAYMWNKFVSYVVETTPNYHDSDFTFNNFMDWYGTLPGYSDGHEHSVDANGNCNSGCC